jgi:hypothetical protein
MHKHLLHFLGFVLTAVLATTATEVPAALTVTISDGTNVLTAGTTAESRGFKLSSGSTPQTGNVTLPLLILAPSSGLNCSTTTPCRRHFPSGNTVAQAGDTFAIQSISATNVARVEKIDIPAGGTATTGVDSVTLRGIKIFALTSTARTLTVTYATQSGDLSPISSSSGNYAAAAKLKGQLRLDTVLPIDGNSGSIAATCNSGVSSPCAQLSVKINLLTLNGTGSTTSALVTASIPCSTEPGSPSPCGGGGFWSPNLILGDQFLASDTGSVGCGTTCAPFWQSTLVVKFNTKDQVFTLTNSAASALAQDTPSGLIDLAEALSEPGIDVWVGACAGVHTGAQPYRTLGEAPFGRLGRNQKDAATFPMTYSLMVGQLLQVGEGFPKFISIGGSEEDILPPGDQERNDACSMSWVPSRFARPEFGNLSELVLDYTAFVLEPADSGDPRLGNLGIIDFTDCTACFRVEIGLVDAGGLNQGTLKVYLGADTNTNHRTNHAGSVAPLALLSDTGYRVDASAMLSKPEPCCMTFAEAQSNGRYGKLFVRSVTVVIDQEEIAPANHLVTNLEAIVNGSSSNDSMLTVGNFQPSCAWPPADGIKIYIYKRLPDGTREFARNVVNPTIQSCQLKAQVKVTDLLGAGTYEAHVIIYSAADDPSKEFTGGIAVPDPGIMILK